MECYEITPSPDPKFDVLVIEHKSDTWRDVLQAVEASLDWQFCRMDADCGKWTDIKVSVRCVEKTFEQLDEMETTMSDQEDTVSIDRYCKLLAERGALLKENAKLRARLVAVEADREDG